MLEANPGMDWREVKRILQETASNIPGHESWEVGAGYVNAYAAVQSTLKAGTFGSTVNATRTFNANAQVSTGSSTDYDVDYSPVGPTETVQFNVAEGISLVAARANVGENTVAISLTDPNGKRYGSSIALPVLGQNIAVSAPGVPGTWSLTVRGVGSVSGNNLDPARVTNGYGVPGTVTVNVKQLRTDGFSGLTDIASHPARGFIEFGVSRAWWTATRTGASCPTPRSPAHSWPTSWSWAPASARTRRSAMAPRSPTSPPPARSRPRPRR
jgi:hypothetical protein